MSVLKALAHYGYAPFMILGLNGLGFYIMVSGASWVWLGALLVVAVATAFVAERLNPFYDDWNHDHGDTPANVIHAIVYEISNINAMALVPVIAWLTPWDGIWPTSWPLFAQFILALVLADFALMMLHFASHRIPVLWRLHAVHHGVPRLYGFNVLVRHPLHQTVDLALGTAPLAIAGMPLEVAVLLGLAISIQLVVQHSNVDYALGPFRPHLSIGRLHHLHHVNWGKEGDVNFGLFLTVWDRILGTLQLEPPRAIKANDMGIDEAPAFPMGYIDQLLFPFRYVPGTKYEPKSAQPEAADTPPPSDEKRSAA